MKSMISVLILISVILMGSCDDGVKRLIMNDNESAVDNENQADNDSGNTGDVVTDGDTTDTGDIDINDADDIADTDDMTTYDDDTTDTGDTAHDDDMADTGDTTDDTDTTDTGDTSDDTDSTDTGTSPEYSCAEIISCATPCSSETCQMACYNSGSAEGKSDFNTFYSCASNAGCLSISDEDQQYLCLVNNCYSQSETCGIDMPDCSESDCSTPNEKECTDDALGIEECLQFTDGCYYWTDSQACDANYVCIGGTSPECVTSVRDAVSESSNQNSEKKNVFKGNEFACSHNATIQSFEIYLDPAYDIGGDTAITFVIFEKSGSTLTNIFEKQITVKNMYVSAQYYSTGDISVNIDAGKNYVLGAMWNRDCRYYYLQSVGQIVNFGSLVQALGKENTSSIPTSLDASPAYSFRMTVTSILR